MKLNGWLRLWVLVSVLSLLAALGISIHFNLSKIVPEPLKEIKIRGTNQILSVPESMSDKEIVAMIKEYQSLGEEELEKQAQIVRVTESFRLMNENLAIDAENRDFRYKLFMAWLVFVASILFLGYGIAWVKNGFKGT